MGLVSSIGVRTTNLTINQACVEIITNSTTVARIRSIDIYQAAATAQTLGLGAPQAIGVTPASPAALARMDRRDSGSGVTVALGWATSPTAPATYLKRWRSLASDGASVSWIFASDGLIIPASSTLVIFNITAAQASDVNIVLEEIATE